MANTQPVGHLPTAIGKGGLSHGKTNIATIKYHWIHVQWKVFDGGYSFRVLTAYYIGEQEQTIHYDILGKKGWRTMYASEMLNEYYISLNQIYINNFIFKYRITSLI